MTTPARAGKPLPGAKVLMPLLFLGFLPVIIGGLFDEFGLRALGVLGALMLLAAIIALPIARSLRATPASRSDLLVELPAVGFLVLAAVFAVGLTLPAAHEVSASARLDDPLERVWIAVMAIPPAPAWRPWVTEITRIPARSPQQTRWRFFNRAEMREHSCETSRFEPPHRMVVEDTIYMAHDRGRLRKVFEGSWNLQLRADGMGTQLTLTERAVIHSSFERVAERLFGYRRNISAYVAAIRELLRRYNDPELLITAIRRRDDTVVEALLALGADPDGRDARGDSPIERAAQHGSVQALRYLIDRSADVASLSKWGYTPLIHVTVLSDDDDAEKLRFLIEAGADVNARDRDGRTALMHAASGGSAEVVGLLLDAGADVSLRDRKGRTAIDFARRYGDPVVGRPEIVKLLQAGSRSPS